MSTTNQDKPLIAITLGDPTGVGPEITVKALTEPAIYDSCTPFVVGSPAALRLACELSAPDWNVFELPSESDFRNELQDLKASSKRIYVLPAGPNDWGTQMKPIIDARGGEAAYASLVKATGLALQGTVDAIVTSPLHKVALYEAGHDWPGHTELLAELCGVKEHAMMLYLPPGQPRHGGLAGLGVVHVTLHIALREVFVHLTPANILEKIELAQRVFQRIRSSMKLSDAPKIAVTALNPHCGEGGRFGDEETTIIKPAVELARAQGIDVAGPLAVDTLMPKAADGEFDAVVAMYHDQGHIALKLLDMFDAVNITLGLPIVRTSVAHGTAHDIAWQNKSKFSGMVQAILTAARLKGVANERIRQ